MVKGTKMRALVLGLVFILMMSSVALAAPTHKDIFEEVSADNIYNHIVALVKANDSHPNGIDNARVTGFRGEWDAADYVADTLESYGLKVEKTEFPILAFLSHGAEVTVNGQSLESKTFTYTPATPKEGITGEIVYCDLGSAADFEKVNVEGKIALIKRGSYSFYDKTQNAAAAGAVGVIIFNNAKGVINGTLGNPTRIPAVALSDVDGINLVALLENSTEPVEVTMIADTEMENSYSQNVIGTLSADRKKDAETIVIGAHYDSVDCPGANDNASGTATMLEIARVLSSKKLAYNVKFMAFGAEEVGLIGSAQYVESLNEKELNNIVAMINMDMVGVGNKVGVMTVNKNKKSFVADLSESYLKDFGIPHSRTTSASSDHAPFEAAGIPVVFLNYGPDPYYHTDADSLDKIDKDNLYNMATLVTAMTYDMSKVPMPKSEKGLRAKVNKYKFVNDEIPME